LIAHELQSPLMAIEGMARSLQDGKATESDRAEALEQITASSHRLSVLVRNMLRLTTNGRTAIECEPLLLRMCIVNALAEHHRRHPGRQVVVELADGLPPVLGESTSIDQVLTNLLSNAVKYGAPSEPIRLTARCVGSEVVVRLANGGDVLEPLNIERVFKPFFRENGSIHQGPGLGLGLVVCRQLVEALSGRIWATARPEGGLEVTFTLPALLPD
jgi:two-component system sensor histidine kinase KdpD